MTSSSQALRICGAYIVAFATICRIVAQIDDVAIAKYASATHFLAFVVDAHQPIGALIGAIGTTLDRSEFDYFSPAIGVASSNDALSIFANLAIGALVGATRAVIEIIAEIDDFVSTIGSAHAVGALSIFANLAIGALVGATRASIDRSQLYDDIITIGKASAVGALSIFANLAIGALVGATRTTIDRSNIDENAVAIRLAHAVDALAIFANLAIGAAILVTLTMIDIISNIHDISIVICQTKAIGTSSLHANLSICTTICTTRATIDRSHFYNSVAAIRLAISNRTLAIFANLAIGATVIAFAAMIQIALCISLDPVA